MAFAHCLCSRVAVPGSHQRRRAVVRASDSPADFEASPPPPSGDGDNRIFTSLVSKTPQLTSVEGTAGIVKVNHYAVLGVPLDAPASQIREAFRNRREQLKRRTDINDDTLNAELQALQESFEILNTEEERRVYDWALKRYQNREGDYIWPYETDITQRYDPKKVAPVMRSFDEEGNRKVGMFLLGWCIIAAIMSATMKTWLPYDYVNFPP